MITRRLTLAGFGTLLALFSNAPLAQADSTNELAFISSLNAFGLSVYDAPAAIGNGYWICQQLPYHNGEDVAANIYWDVDFYDTLDVARAWVVAAAMNLCPSQYHPERLVAY